MTLNCSAIVERHLAALSKGFACLPEGDFLRVITPYVYPNNDFIELFLKDMAGGQVKVSDLGETLRQLHNQGFDVAAGSARRETAEIIANRTNVDLRRGALEKAGASAEVGELLLDVAAAARGVADLIYTSRAYEPATFLEEIGQFLDSNRLEYETKARLTGLSSRVYTVQFRIRRGPTYLHSLSPRLPGGAKSQVDSLFRMWSDCDSQLTAERKVSLLNDMAHPWRGSDVALLGRVSTVIFWTKRDELFDRVPALQAAKS